MPKQNLNEQDQRLGNTNDATHTIATNDVDVEQHEGTPTAPETGTEGTLESSDPGCTNNEDVDQSKETQTSSEEGSGTTQTVQEDSTKQYLASLTKINQNLSGLLEEQTGLLVEKLNTGNQTLDEIKKDIENFKEKNLLEAGFVIHNLIQFYDTFVLVESQLKAINETFESLGNQIDVIPDIPQNDAILGTLKSVKNWIDERLSGQTNKSLWKHKKYATELDSLHGLLQSNPSPSQEDAEEGDGLTEHQEETKDWVSSLSQVNTEMKDKLFKFQNNLENARYEFEETLARIDVVPYKTIPDEASDLRFDREKHKAIDSERIDDETQHLQVAESHKTGFYRIEKGEDEKQTVFRPEEVTVYRYEKPADEPTDADDEVSADENETADIDTEGTTEESSNTAGDVSAKEKGDE